ncbi:MAG TPA: hypothetical protein QF564_17705 [Pirellulaceae bacterium]|nr:hypothetical protein [Pirellulaceae bacterium]
MNTAIFWRVVWKEYRQQRALWCAIVAAGIIMQVGVILYSMLNEWSELTNGLFTVALSVPVLYSLGCGAVLFAGEHEAETFSFQRALPVAAGRIFAAKLALAVASLLALFPVLWCVAWAFASWNLPDNSWHLQLWAGGTIAAIEVLFWAVFSSLLLRRVLPAAVVSGLIAVLLGYSSLVLVVAFDNLFQQQLDEYFSTLPLRSLTALMALAVAIKLGKRWFNEHPPLSQMRRERTGVSVAGSTRAATATHVMVMRRLVWHEWRQSRLTIFWLTAGYIALFIWFGCILSTLQSPRFHPQWEVMLVLLPVLATALGASTFWSDQQGQRYHFFAEHGVRPRLVWFSRQLTWGTVLAIVALIACIPLLFGWPEDEEIPAAALGLTVLLFAAGQTCSMFIRSGIVAVFSAILCSLVLCGWSALLVSMRVWWVVSLLPLPLIFLWATWLYAPKWIQQRTSWRVRIATAASIMVPILIVLAATAAYRVYEIPAIKMSFTPTIAETRAPIPPEASETAGMYFEAISLLQSRVEVDEVGEVTITERDEEWRRGIELFVAASERPDCHFSNWSDLSNVAFFVDGRTLANAAIAEARQLTADGDLSGAAKLYDAIMRFAAHHYQQPSSHLYITYAQRIEDAVWPELPKWAAHPEQTHKAVLEMLIRVRDFSAKNELDWEQGTRERYALVRRFIELDDKLISGYYGIDTVQGRLIATLYWLMPWERARTSRLLELYTESELQRLANQATLPPSRLWPWPVESTEEVTLTRRDGRRIVVTEKDLAPWVRTTPWFQLTTAFGFSYQRTTDAAEMHRRAVQVQLALVAWSMEHEELPLILEELVGHGLEQRPVDPYTGQLFVYVREGVEQEVWDDATSGMMGAGGMGGMMMGMGSEGTAPMGMEPVQPKLVRTEPFIWSPAEQLYYIPGPRRGPSRSPIFSDFRVDRGQRTADGGVVLPNAPLGAQLVSDVQLLQYGTRFLIPKQANSLPRDERAGE